MKFMVQLKARIDRWFDEQQVALDQRKAEERSGTQILDEIARKERLGVEGRLLEHFKAYRTGAIDLDDYRAEIMFEREGVKEAMKDLRANRKHIASGDFEEQMMALEEDLDDTAWRLEWVNEQRNN
jgi:hypothetical protein